MNNIEYIFTQTGNAKHSVTLPIKTITSTIITSNTVSHIGLAVILTSDND